MLAWPGLVWSGLVRLGLAWPSRGAKGRLPDFVSSFSALIKIITRVFFSSLFSCCVLCCFFFLRLLCFCCCCLKAANLKRFMVAFRFVFVHWLSGPIAPGYPATPRPPPPPSLLTAIFESSAFPTRNVDGQLARPTQTDCNLNGVFSFFPPFS